ncbi:LysR family transcriptional regulator [Micromonospora sp. NPDC049559]|uniref:LysR family transcriptional regulator n=1 Tax=Micromonospora sp. NPDC049559 TaxID=3155923 RepID=UPI0034402070
MLDVRRLVVLREIERCGSFTAAARSLGYSQSAVSQQIAALERETATTLVRRRRGQVGLTDAGRALVVRTENILAELAAAQADLRALAAGQAGVLRLAMFATAAATFVPDAAARLRARCPGVELRLELIELPDEATAAVTAGEVDLALLVQPGDRRSRDRPGLSTQHLFDDPLLAVLPADHPHATRDHVDLADLADEPWLVPGGPGCPDAALLLRACRAAGFEPRPAVDLTTDDYGAVRAMAAAGLGVSVLPRLALLSPGSEVAVRPLRPRRHRRVVAVHRTGHLAPAAETMIEVMREAANRGAGPGPRADGDVSPRRRAGG